MVEETNDASCVSPHSAIPEETNDTRTAESTKELTATGAKVVTLAVGANATACAPSEPSSALLSLNAVPTAACVAPGACQFGAEWRAVPLLARKIVNHNTRLLSFACPDEHAPLGLSTCACLLARGAASADGGEPVVRPYTPVSTNATVGRFELLVKVYPEGQLSRQLDALDIGASVEFKHIPFNVKRQYPFGVKNLIMLIGGTGIAPMIQALHAVLGTEGDETCVTLLYGSRTLDDILGGDILDAWCQAHSKRLHVTHVLSHEDEGSTWKGERGFITREHIAARCAPPSDPSTLIFVCGPPDMYAALCGARGEDELSGVLAEMGYSKEQVVKF